MIARMILGWQSIIFKVAFLVHRAHSSTSSWSVVSLRFSPGALSLLVHLEKSPQILSHLACNHGFLEDNRFLHGPRASFPRINLNSLTPHVHDERFCVEFGLIIHDQQLKPVTFTRGHNLLVKNFFARPFSHQLKDVPSVFSKHDVLLWSYDTVFCSSRVWHNNA